MVDNCVHKGGVLLHQYHCWSLFKFVQVCSSLFFQPEYITALHSIMLHKLLFDAAEERNPRWPQVCAQFYPVINFVICIETQRSKVNIRRGSEIGLKCGYVVCIPYFFDQTPQLLFFSLFVSATPDSHRSSTCSLSVLL